MTPQEKLSAVRVEIEKVKETKSSFNDKISHVIVKYCNYFLDIFNNLSEEQVSEDLKEAAKEYEQTRYDTDAVSDNEVVRRAFRAGAQWQKEQMMKDSIEVTIGNEWGHPKFELDRYILEPKDIKCCDKVKLIIIKEDYNYDGK